MVVGLFALGAAGCAALVSGLNSVDFNFGSIGRTHLHPIPVSKAACPYVIVMHTAANNFQRVNPVENLAFAGKPLVSWPVQRAQLAHTLEALDSAVVAGEAQFPAPIQSRLAVVHTSIRKGEMQLVRAHNVFDLATRTSNDFSDAQYAFGDASDLVGNACGVQLAADPVPVG